MSIRAVDVREMDGKTECSLTRTYKWFCTSPVTVVINLKSMWCVRPYEGAVLFLPLRKWRTVVVVYVKTYPERRQGQRVREEQQQLKKEQQRRRRNNSTHQLKLNFLQFKQKYSSFSYWKSKGVHCWRGFKKSKERTNICNALSSNEIKSTRVLYGFREGNWYSSYVVSYHE